MATRSNESLSELERRSEQTRAELAQTVDALHNRVSPAALKADVKSYVRDNPLQAAAIAVGAAYPVWRMVSALPAPVLLVGAGLAMARRNGGSSSYASGTGEGMMATLKDKASDLTSQLTEKAQDTMDSLRARVSDTTARTADTLSSTYDSTKQAATDTMRQVSERVSDRASETYAQASEQLSDMIDRHPLLVGGVALAVGGLVAAAVPVSRPENRLMGETAEEVRRRSEDLAMQGFRHARDVARQVYETATEEVRQEGLTPEAARRAARSAVDTAREAVERSTSGNRS